MDVFARNDVVATIEDLVGLVEIRRGPNNFFDVDLIEAIADAFTLLAADGTCRAIVLASEGKAFCAGADFSRRTGTGNQGSGANLYRAAVRLFECPKPIIAALQGPAIGGGLGLALVADFRVAAPEARFAANFVKLGIHPGFGITATLPRLIGPQRASLMLYTGRRIRGEEAVTWGLADMLAPQDQLRAAACALAAEIAEAAPLAVLATRATIRKGIAELVRAQTEHELAEQTKLFATADYREGVRSVAERRPGRFVGA
ncbi:enoyl-CoA hydratase [Bradyrhizobium sp. CCBAU 45394]|uniref:enoyl-CoA hydratase/isomerase family protein n=1 Tax=unclassified Bradyrhizobium TaxID=2631580 RepID=UPI0023037C89|nr:MULTISPECIES: enoyl-CoA hydratase/isomerase family protein [unclassified Bradyrhizobium]MDA9392224.1 enoyl-CoA hydratase [Bradyrhizobium sp. CCBAU 45394]MDA9537825.1 enoyl-CoA hydratase [Bradyrhizobium sp. CCBAU 21362]